MRIYLKNNLPKFPPDLIRNEEDLGFLRQSSQREQRQQDE